jgi:hypothetical protein
VPHTLSDPREIKSIKGSTERTHILNDLEVDSFDRITTGNESWFQYPYESSDMFAKLPGDVVPRTRKGMMAGKTRKNSRQKASYALLIHLILLT